MARYFFSNNKIKVIVANGSTHSIRCSVYGDQALMKQGVTGGSLDEHDKGVNTHKAEQVQHIAGATPDYLEIPKGNALEFESSTPSNRVFMTVINENDRTICNTHEIGTSRNYIIDHNDALLNAKKNKKWIDTKGRDHEVLSSEPFSLYRILSGMW